MAGLPAWFWYVVAALWGAAWGSFANVVIHRLPAGESLVHPPSHCPVCGRTLRWWHNVPLISYLVLRGRCAYCGARISPRYPTVEAVSTLLALYSMHRALAVHECPSILLALTDFHFAHALLILSFIDFETFILPDAIVLPGTILFLVIRSYYGHACYGAPWLSAAREPLVGAAAGFGILASVAWLYRIIRKREGMGLGDAKLLGMVGAYLGPLALVWVILLASLQGMLLTVALYALGVPLPRPRPYSGITTQEELDEIFPPDEPLSTRPIPFGPFIALGAVEALWWGDVLMSHFTNVLYG